MRSPSQPTPDLPVKQVRREKRPRLPDTPPKAYRESPDDGFHDRLAKIASDIRIAANGRVCGSCKHFRSGWCADKMSVTPSNFGNNLQVMFPTAVACGQHVAIVG